MIKGYWSEKDLKWNSDVRLAEEEANRRYPHGCFFGANHHQPNSNEGLTNADFNMRAQFYDASKEHKKEGEWKR